MPEKKTVKIPARLIGIIGPSGTGKSTCAMNLPKEYSAICNTEQKRLPFPKSEEFDQYAPKSFEETIKWLKDMLERKSLRIAFLDSFTALTDRLMYECQLLYQGFDVYSNYNKKMYQFFEACKDVTNAGIFLAMTGHDDGDDDASGSGHRHIKVHGNAWKNRVEKEFDVILFSEAHPSEDNPERMSYYLRTNTNSYVPAKSPMGMFSDEEILIPNDLADILKRISDYDKGDVFHEQINVKKMSNKPMVKI